MISFEIFLNIQIYKKVQKNTVKNYGRLKLIEIQHTFYNPLKILTVLYYL